MIIKKKLNPSIMPLREITPSIVRQFLGIFEDTVYTIIPNGFGTYIVVAHTAHNEAEIIQSHITQQNIELTYHIKL